MQSSAKPQGKSQTSRVKNQNTKSPITTLRQSKGAKLQQPLHVTPFALLSKETFEPSLRIIVPMFLRKKKKPPNWGRAGFIRLFEGVVSSRHSDPRRVWKCGAPNTHDTWDCSIVPKEKKVCLRAALRRHPRDQWEPMWMPNGTFVYVCVFYNEFAIFGHPVSNQIISTHSRMMSIVLVLNDDRKVVQCLGKLPVRCFPSIPLQVYNPRRLRENLQCMFSYIMIMSYNPSFK